MLRSSISNSNARDLFRFGLECGLFAILLFGLHFLVYQFRGPRDIPEEIAKLRAAVADGRTDVVYFGDSSLFMGEAGEADSRTIPAMLQDRMPEVRIAEISSAAGQMELYELLAGCLADHPSRIETVVLPLNMRMMAPQLEERSYRYFDRERLFLEHDSGLFEVMYRPLVAFKTFQLRSASVDEFDDAPVLDGADNLGPLGAFNPSVAVPVTPEQRQRIITFSYMYEFSPAARAAQQLVSLIRTLDRAGIETVLYVTPIDADACEQDLGPRFSERLNSNVDRLRQIAVAEGAHFVDLSREIRHENFAWRYYPNEHLNAAGREHVAKRLVESVRDAARRP